jgi:hypothetical protein
LKALTTTNAAISNAANAGPGGPALAMRSRMPIVLSAGFREVGYSGMGGSARL